MKQPAKFKRNFLKPFFGQNGVDIQVVIVFIIINSIVLINAILHDPQIGYDARAHLKYIDALSQVRLVSQHDTYEFYSPPLPYLLPALFLLITKLDLFWVGKFAQLINFFLSCGTTYFLIRSCDLIYPKTSLKLNTLIMFGILPVYYKTFSQVRGETYLAFFAVLLFYETLLIVKHRKYSMAKALMLGMTMGLIILSRQWGIFLIPGVFLLLGNEWIRFPTLRKSIFKLTWIAMIILVILGGWFYLSLQVRFGAATAFNRDPSVRFSLRNQAKDFYLDLQRKELFKKPVRPNFPNLFLPTFYSEIWGDYWGYFTLYGVDTRGPTYLDGYEIRKFARGEINPVWLKTNYHSIKRYLGRVNLVSLFPTLIYLLAVLFPIIGIVWREKEDLPGSYSQQGFLFLLLSILLTMLGYFWFLIMYPSLGKGDTIKATYVIQIFPYLAVLGGQLLSKLKTNFTIGYWVVLVLLGIVFIHNLPASITHFHFIRLL